MDLLIVELSEEEEMRNLKTQKSMKWETLNKINNKIRNNSFVLKIIYQSLDLSIIYQQI